MKQSEGFLHSYILNGRGGAEPVDLAAVQQWSKEQGVLWVHLDVNDDMSRSWLLEGSGIQEHIVDLMLAEETRPRSLATEQGLLVVLRGVNTNPGEDPEDMVSIRIWVESHRIVTTRRRRVLSVQDVRASLEKGDGPRLAGEFLATFVERLADRIGDFVDGIEERLGEAEGNVSSQDTATFRRSLGLLRRQMASVRRFLAPQRDALDRLYRQAGIGLSDNETRYLREESDRITRYLEDLDLARERAVVLQEEFLGQLAQEQNARMYVLSVVAAIFLPLTFITGLLGMNVGGLPGLESPIGFLTSVVAMVGAAVLLLIFFRWKKWL
jgi:zinc transporter